MQATLLTVILALTFGQNSYTFFSLTEAKENPEKVERLILEKQKLRSIPDSLYIFPYLKELDLSKNKIDFLGAEIGECTALQTLKINNNQISTIPPQIGKLIQLKELDLSRNKIDQLPEEIGKLMDLEVLTLHGNAITTLPQTIENLNKLKLLDLRQMDITEAQLKSLHQALPDTKILYTVSCNCGF
jgi:Leucine-rich repeat (LRR) protein